MTSDPDTVVADSHALIWYLTRSPRLSVRARELLETVEHGDVVLVVPTIVLAEILRIAERKNPGISFEQVTQWLAQMPSTVIVSLDMYVLDEARKLPSDIEMHDRIIAATAIIYGAPVITRDRILTAKVTTIW